jgi:hypothetical protein
MRMRPARPPGTMQTFSQVYCDGLPWRWCALYSFATASRRGLIPLVGPYSRLPTEMLSVLGRSGMSLMPVWSCQMCRAINNLHVEDSLTLSPLRRSSSSPAVSDMSLTIRHLRRALTQVGPFVRTVIVAALGSSFRRPDNTSRRPRRVKTGVWLVSFVSLTELHMYGGVEFCVPCQWSRVRQSLDVRWACGQNIDSQAWPTYH